MMGNRRGPRSKSKIIELEVTKSMTIKDIKIEVS